MDKFLTLPDENRKELFEETARKLEILPIIVEKDFWVCWTLKQLFSLPELSSLITFKGGTSLSKAYKMIDRFSEDIDLTISRAARSFADVADPMESDISGKERQRRIDALKIGAQSFVADIAAPVLQRQFESRLDQGKWKISIDEDDRDKQTLSFSYPRLLSYGQGYGRGGFGVGRFGEGEFGYIKPVVKLEFGARGEIEPSTEKAITPCVADIYPQFFDTISCNVHVLTAERTFWEKATILHALYHGTKIRDRMSRHYYDTYVLAEKGIADAALQDTSLLAQVVRNKSLMYADNKASYETAETPCDS
ncbi:MAG: nucleotidyl transferase AbiEii/AbiGii toxin family protein [Methylocystaceae bacterium]|nr:nucleotidyl transferase AbiEii/AbiGii toxin family protein [Methylocystaceae bacterium]